MGNDFNVGAVGEAGQDWQTNETLLLLSLLNLALTNIDIATTCRVRQDREAAVRCLMRAVETYGSVKSLLPKLDLRQDQTALIRERLDVVRQRLWAGPMNAAGR